MPRPSSPVGAKARGRRQRSSSFPRPTRSHAYRCSRLTRPDGGERSGLVTLTFLPWTWKVVSESHVTWATSVPILVFLGLSVLDLGPMYATDVVRQTSYIRQQHRLMPPPLGRGMIIIISRRRRIAVVVAYDCIYRECQLKNV